MRRGIALALVAATAIFGLAEIAHAKDVGQSESIGVQPAQGRVGQKFTFLCKDFPEPKSGDAVYVVPTGTPDVDPNNPEGEKILWKDYAVNCYNNKGRFIFPAGPFAPGNYEVRFSTTLYNNDNRVEIATRTPFSVR